MSSIEVPEFNTLGNIKNFAFLDLVQIKLLLPQSEIKSIESGFDVKNIDDKKYSERSIKLDDKEFPVYCFSTDLSSMQYIPDEYRVCVVVQSDKYCFGVLCSQITTIEHSQLRFYPIPGCMHTEHSPIFALAQYERQVICISSALRLAKFMKTNQ